LLKVGVGWQQLVYFGKLFFCRLFRGKHREIALADEKAFIALNRIKKTVKNFIEELVF
jgi:hypothetical protein